MDKETDEFADFRSVTAAHCDIKCIGREDDVARLIDNVNFRHVNNEFMTELERDKRKIESSTNIFVPADKTRNYYEMHPSDYKKLLTQNVTKSYKHAQEHIATNITREFRDIVDEMKLCNRTDPMRWRDLIKGPILQSGVRT